jgi:hypothetical protein
MTVDVTTTQNPVTVSVNDTNVSVSVTDNVTTATVSGGTGPQGPTGPQGDPASLTPATTTAIGGIIVGTGLSVTGNGTLSATGAVSSVAGRTGAVTLTTADVSGYTAPPVSSVAGRTGTVTLTTSDISGYTSPPVSSVAGRTGTVTLTTSDISGFTTAASAAAPVQSVAGRTGAVVISTSDVSGYAAPPVTSVAGRTGAVVIASGDVSGLGTVATLDVAAAGNATSGQVVKGNDTRLSDSRTPSSTLAHASTHGSAGSDPVSIAYTQVSGLGTLATQSGTFSGTSSGTNTGDQTVTLTGDVTGSGTGSFAATLAASGATEGTYTSVTVDAKGRVTAGTNPAAYSLPTATASVLGGIKIGSGLSIDGSGVVSAASSYTLPDATTVTKGGVIVGTGLSVSSGTVSANVTSVAGRTGAVTIASGDVSGLATSATTDTTNAANISSGTLPDARLSANVALAANVNLSIDSISGGFDIFPRRNINALGYTLSNTYMYLTFFTPMVTLTVSKIVICSGNAGSGLTACRLGLFTMNDTTGVATCVAKCDNDTTIGTTTGTIYTRSFSTTGGFPSTYTLQAGTRYGFGIYSSATSPISISGQTMRENTQLSLLPRLCGLVTGYSGTDFTTSNTVSVYTFSPVPWARFAP